MLFAVGMVITSFDNFKRMIIVAIIADYEPDLQLQNHQYEVQLVFHNIIPDQIR